VTDLDDELREYIAFHRAERDKGHTLAALHVGLQTVTDAQSAHEQKCDRRWAILDDHRKVTNDRLERLEARRSSPDMPTLPPIALPPPLPPMRDRQQSVFELEQYTAKVAEAIEVGTKSPDTTPAVEVKAVVIEELARKDAERELGRLQLFEKAQQAAQEAAVAAERERVRMTDLAKSEARKMRLNILLTALAALALFIVERAIEAAAKGHF
jgi:hypothetical protein